MTEDEKLRSLISMVELYDVTSDNADDPDCVTQQWFVAPFAALTGEGGPEAAYNTISAWLIAAAWFLHHAGMPRQADKAFLKRMKAQFLHTRDLLERGTIQ